MEALCHSRELASDRGPPALEWCELSARKLSLEAILRGHSGCVNRLAWNESGTLLASGSDDRDARLWRWPQTHVAPLIVPTAHDANIFGVAFLPQTGSAQVITAGMDRTVQLHHLDASPLQPVAHPQARGARHDEAEAADEAEGSDASVSRARVASARTTVFACHRGRVKGVEVEPGNPHLFFSAAEDGAVRQFDTRTPLNSMQRYDSPNVLLSLDARGPRRPLELKALALNPVRPNELAVAAADEQVRIYDRRRLSLGAPRAGGAPPPPPLLQLAPPHLAPGGPGGARVHTTAVAFGNAGDKIVASYHSDHAYTWDTLAAAPAEPSAALPTPSGRAGGRVAVRAAAPPAPDLFSHAANGLWSLLDPGRGARSAIPGLLPPGADRERAEGDAAVLQRRFFDAVQHFTEALYLAPTCAALYSSRAGALLRRGWRGDAFAALRDCEASLALDPGSRRALLRRAQALHACGLLAAAQAAARLHRAAFGGDDELLTLEDEVAAGLRQRAQQDEARREQQEQQRNIRRRRGFSRERRQRRRSSAGGGDAASSEEASPAASEPAAARFMPSAGTAAGQEASRSDEMELESHASSEEDDDDAPAGASPSAIDAYDQAYAAAIERAAAAAAAKPGGSIGPPPPPPGAPHPSLWAALPGGARLLRRFVGHCNQQTDIKEACFLGGDDALVAAGSDDGRVFIYAAATGALVRVLQADADVANCVRPHPHLPVLATSGIESVVKLWSPEGPEQAGGELAALAAANQDRVRELRTQEVFLGQGLRLLEMLTESNAALVMGGGEADGGAGEGQAAGEGDGGGGGPGVVQCRMA